MLSVTASGRAPTAVRLRHASATACAPPGFGVGGAVARRAVGGQRQRPRWCRRAAPRRRRPRPAASRSGRRRCCRTGPRSRRASTGPGSRSARIKRVAPGRVAVLDRAERRRRRASRRSGGDRAAPGRPAARAGCRPPPRRSWRTTMRPVSVRWPMTAKSSSHFSKIARASVLAVGPEHHQHPLLALRQHHLVGGHAGLALRHRVEVEFDADAALAGHLDRGTGQAGRAHVLDRDDGVGRHQFQAGLDQQLLGERIADLHGGPLVLGVLGRTRRTAMVAPWMPSRPVFEPT